MGEGEGERESRKQVGGMKNIDFWGPGYRYHRVAYDRREWERLGRAFACWSCQLYELYYE